MRIGLLGGTFDPIHNGHLQIAERVFARMKLNLIFFIPTGKSPHKQNLNIASKKHRCKMIRLALEDKPRFTLCDIEIKSHRISYTVDTISALKRLHPDDRFFFIIGIDAFLKLSEWKDPERLLSLCPFVIVPRIMKVSSSEIRTRIREGKSVKSLLPKNVLSYIMEQGVYTKADAG